MACNTIENPGWLLNGGPLPNNVLSRDNKIYIRKIKRFNEGVYFCIGFLDKLNWFHEYMPFLATTVVRVHGEM